MSKQTTRLRRLARMKRRRADHPNPAPKPGHPWKKSLIVPEERGQSNP